MLASARRASVPRANSFLCFVAFTLCLAHVAFAQSKDTPEKIRQTIVAAGESYRAGKIDSATQGLNDAVTRLQQAVASATDPATMRSLKTLHGGLVSAYQKLELDGVVLAPLPTWEEMLAARNKPSKAPAEKSSPTAPDTGVKFASDVAPWLISKCGRCHINEAKGSFSMATMADLLKGSKGGSVIIDRDAEHSRLVEVIVSGDMPRGGTKVSITELASLKEWINQGVAVDPKLLPQSLASIAKQAGSATPTDENATMSNQAAIRKPTGRESVAFAKDIAPILVAQCAGCHYNAQQLRGGLNMNSFAQFWKGGDSGTVIEPGKGEASLIVKKLRGMGSGQRMPAGRPALSEAQISMISKWIDEGAAYDGDSPDARLENVATQAWAQAATAEEMAVRRREKALEKWKIAFSKVEPAQASDANFVVIGDVGQNSVDRLLQETNTAYEKVRKALKLNDDAPLAKGGVTVFAVKNRYDYSEFGKMNESRSLPPQWSGHWRRAVVDVYVALLYDAKDAKANQAQLTQQLASLWMSGKEETPNWFADGFGRATLAMVNGRSEPRIKVWDQQLPTAIKGMSNVKDLLDGKMNEEDAAVLGYAFVRKMIDTPNRKAFDTFLRALDQTQHFEEAFQQSFGRPVEPTIATTFGLNPTGKGKKR